MPKSKPQIHKDGKPVDQLVGGEEYELKVEPSPPSLALGDRPPMTWEVAGPAKIAGNKSLLTDDLRDPSFVVVTLTVAGEREELKLPVVSLASTVKVAPKITPDWEVDGRPGKTFGVGEGIVLSYDLAPAVEPLRLGGLIWEAKGPATVGSPSSRSASLAATNTTGDDVTLNLKVRSGASTGLVLATETIHVIPPSGVAMERKAGTGVHHIQGNASAGFVGKWFFQPNNVSFHNLEFKEEACGSAMSGCFSHMQWAKDGHKANTKWSPAAADLQAAKGTPISGTDTAYSGQFAPARSHRPVASLVERVRGLGAPVKAPYQPGDFEPGSLDWNIPVSYQIKGTADSTPFGHELQHMECSDVGEMVVSKLGVSVKTAADDPTVLLPQVASGQRIVQALPGLQSPTTP